MNESVIPRSKLWSITPSRQSPNSCKHDFGSLLAEIIDKTKYQGKKEAVL